MRVPTKLFCQTVNFRYWNANSSGFVSSALTSHSSVDLQIRLISKLQAHDGVFIYKFLSVIKKDKRFLNLQKPSMICCFRFEWIDPFPNNSSVSVEFSGLFYVSIECFSWVYYSHCRLVFSGTQHPVAGRMAARTVWVNCAWMRYANHQSCIFISWHLLTFCAFLFIQVLIVQQINTVNIEQD